MGDVTFTYTHTNYRGTKPAPDASRLNPSSPDLSLTTVIAKSFEKSNQTWKRNDSSRVRKPTLAQGLAPNLELVSL